MKKTNAFAARAVLCLVAFGSAALSSTAFAVAQLHDELVPYSKSEVDYRLGSLQPLASQLDVVRQLGAKATWNRFGTVHTLVKRGGYLAQGLSGEPVAGAREWLRQNRALFKLSAQGVDDLELVNEGVTPYNEARAVLFRQRFAGLAVATDGLITVGIVKGKVYYVSSSSVGDDQPPAGAATLTPVQAWTLAAANVNRHVTADLIKSVRDLTKTTGWNVLSVAGFSEPQRARLAAMAMPNGGVRQVYETIVLDNSYGIPTAFVHYIDAQSGKVLRRENRVYNAAADMIPQPFTGTTPDEKSCGAKSDFTVGTGNAALNITASAVLPTNAISLNLYFTDPVTGSKKVASAAGLTGPAEVITYAPSGGVAAGSYQVEVCASTSFLNMAPYNYVGVFVATPIDTSVTSPVTGADAAAPQWKWFTSNPDISYDGADLRKVTCFAALPVGGLSGCDIDSTTLATRGPWDTLEGGLVPTFTTIGNNAITAGDAVSPLTPSVPNQPHSVTRKYDFPFTNAWFTSNCGTAGLIASQVPDSNGNDLSAVTANLFTMHNRMHDFAYLLGFTERNYNLQLSNFGLTSATQGNDPELGSTQAGALGGMPGLPTYGTLPGRNNANQIALMDGVPGITNQYLFQPVGGSIYPPCTDGALDTGIAGHEYTHAISNRMVGGPDGNLSGAQAGSMGESWSDLNATEYQYENGFINPGAKLTALAAYTTGNPERGIRDYPLDDNPLNYGNIGFDTPGPEVHADGEVWNGTQWALRQAFVDKYQAGFDYGNAKLQLNCAYGRSSPDACPGNRRWIQLVYDAWLLLPGDTSMLDARDAMLAADMARFDGANQEIMWKVFANRGMGEFAYSNGTDDTAPIPNFESPLTSDEAEVTFKVMAGDENKTAVTNARILVGRFATRTRQIADTDPATVVDTTDETTTRTTLINRDTAKLVPATYEFIVIAPGYGIHRFTQALVAGKSTMTFTLPTNYASITKGAEVATSATLQENIDLKDTLIDDSEDTGAVIGDEGFVAGAYAIIKLAGGEHTISGANISMSAGPNNSGRWGAVRQFELRSCSGTCANPATDFQTVVFKSADNAFPGGIPRPLQPDLYLRSFEFAPVKATHLQFRVVSSQCYGNPDYVGDKDSDPLNDTDCPTASGLISGLNLVLGGDIQAPAPGSYARATDIQLFGSKASMTADGTSTGGTPPVITPPGTVPTAAGDTGRFGGGAAGLALLLPLLVLAMGRRRRLA